MNTKQFKQIIKEVISEIGYEDRDIQLYRWIQMRLKRENNPSNIEALRQVATMIEREKGGLLNREPAIRGMD